MPKPVFTRKEFTLYSGQLFWEMFSYRRVGQLKPFITRAFSLTTSRMTRLLPHPEAAFSSTELLGKALDCWQRNLPGKCQFRCRICSLYPTSLNKDQITYSLKLATYRPGPDAVPASNTKMLAPFSKACALVHKRTLVSEAISTQIFQLGLEGKRTCNVKF